MKKPISIEQKRKIRAFLIVLFLAWAIAVVSSIPEPDVNDLHYWVVIDCRVENCKENTDVR